MARPQPQIETLLQTPVLPQDHVLLDPQRGCDIVRVRGPRGRPNDKLDRVP